MYRLLNTTPLRTLLACGLLAACTSGGGDEAAAPAEAEANTAEAAAPEAEAAGEEAAEAAAEAPAEEAPAAAANAGAVDPVPPIPAGQTPPADAPQLPGFEFPNFGTVQPGNAYFPTQDTAAKLTAGEVGEGGMSWFRGEVVSVDGATATVKDLQDNEYPVPVAYVIQAAEAVTEPQVGEIYLGARFNRAELVIVTGPLEDGEVTSMGLPGFMSDRVRDGFDEPEALVPVVDGGVGANVVCHGENGVRNYRILRRTEDKVLGYDGAFVRVLDNEFCRFAPLKPELQAGDEIVYTWSTRYREATVQSVDAANGAVTVTYPWGDEAREDTARFGSIVRTLPPEPAE